MQWKMSCEFGNISLRTELPGTVVQIISGSPKPDLRTNLRIEGKQNL